MNDRFYLLYGVKIFGLKYFAIMFLVRILKILPTIFDVVMGAIS